MPEKKKKKKGYKCICLRKFFFIAISNGKSGESLNQIWSLFGPLQKLIELNFYLKLVIHGVDWIRPMFMCFAII